MNIYKGDILVTDNIIFSNTLLAVLPWTNCNLNWWHNNLLWNKRHILSLYMSFL